MQPTNNTHPVSDYLEVPGCDLIITTPPEKSIPASRAAAILMRLKPDTQIEIWFKIKQ